MQKAPEPRATTRVARQRAARPADAAAPAASTARPTVSRPAAKPTRSVARRPAPPRRERLDDKFLAEQRELLLGERSTYVEQAQDLRAEADSLVEEMEPGDVQFDEESGEGGTVTVDRERDLALSAQALAAVEEIDEALAKIRAGTYGYCENCGAVIPRTRLRALPYARLCVACKSGGLSRR